jgi:hypothetical protein
MVSAMYWRFRPSLDSGTHDTTAEWCTPSNELLSATVDPILQPTILISHTIFGASYTFYRAFVSLPTLLFVKFEPYGWIHLVGLSEIQI